MAEPDAPTRARRGDDRQRPGSRGAHPRRRIVGALLLAALAVAVWSVVTALVAAHRLEQVRSDVGLLTRSETIDRSALEQRLVRDAQTADSAADLLHQPGPRLVGWIPLIGRSIDAERSVAVASAAALRAGKTLATTTDGLGDGRGGVDITRLGAAATAMQRAAAEVRGPLADLAGQPVSWTPPPVQDGVRLARDQLLGLGPLLERSAAGLQALTGVLGGDGRRTVLVGLMNNAELRGAGGLLSAYATGTAEDGHLRLGPFQDVNDVARPPGQAQRVPAPPAFHSEYGAYLADTTLWKNVTMSPQSAQSAEVLSAVAAASIGVHADVVVLCDVPAAASIISATGPVEIQGQEVSGDQLTKRLLVDAYGDGSLSAAKQEARRKALTMAASAAFSRLKGSATATPALLRALLDAVSGRHLVLWSQRPAEERDLAAAGMAGAVDAAGKDVSLIATNNLGDSPEHGNKLDYYVDRQVSIDVRLDTDTATVSQDLTLRNDAPEGLGPYVDGVAHPGRISELLSFDVAADATLSSFTRDGVSVPIAMSSADGAKRLTTVVQLPRGATTRYRLTYRLPLTDHRYELLLVPQALANPAQLHLHVSVSGARMGVITGIDQPRDGVIDLREPWNAVRAITVPVRPLPPLQRLGHAIARFWTHKVPA